MTNSFQHCHNTLRFLQAELQNAKDHYYEIKKDPLTSIDTLKQISAKISYTEDCLATCKKLLAQIEKVQDCG